MNTIVRTARIEFFLGKTDDNTGELVETQVFGLDTQTKFSAVGLTNATLDEYVGIFFAAAAEKFVETVNGKVNIHDIPLDPFSGKSHGLTPPKGETSEARDVRIDSEAGRQVGYYDGLHSLPSRDNADEYYQRGYGKGAADAPDYLRGYNDGASGEAEKELIPAYSIGWHEGCNYRKHMNG